MVSDMRGDLQSQAIDLLPQLRSADVSSVNEQDRTVDLIFSTGAAVERYDWRSGSRYIEKLSMNPDHIMLQRLNSGAPLLNSHSAWSLENIFGAVVRGTAKVEKGKATATVKFSVRQAVEDYWRDVKAGVITAVSTAYRVYRFEETAAKDGGLPTRLATLWEPHEISLVAIPADPGARVRGEQQVEANRCFLVPAHTDSDRERRYRFARLAR